MLLASVFIKTLMKKVKIIKNCTPILDILFHRLTSNSTLTQMFLPVYINIILTLFLMYNSLVLFTHKKSVQLSSYIYYILSCSKKSFSSEQEEFNVNYSTCSCVMFTFHLYIDCQETKSNTCNQNRSSSSESF